MTAISRAQVLAFRYAAHDLDPDAPDRSGETVLATGIQDYPPGRSAALALRLRTASPPPTVLLHSIRGAMHLHRAADLPRLAAALRIEDVRDLPAQSIGPFGTDLADEGIAFDTALDEVATAMRTAITDGRPLTKGELSGLVSPEVDQRLTPWCEGCGAAHVHDQLFRRATLQAGLAIEVDTTTPSQFRYRPADPLPPADPVESRAALVRGFLATFGPARPADLASWLAITPKAARRWWNLIADDLRPVEIDGTKYWTHIDHLDRLQTTDPTTPRETRLLPPYDPLTELADRHLLVPDATQRKTVWRPAANPGILLVDTEIAGTWRQHRSGDRLTLKLHPFTKPSTQLRDAVTPDATTIAAQTNASTTTVQLD
ncbi:winged helix DNA-binding domain-containing protein [Actinomadura sp. KC06]|uniref:winged helix DNA-binding domain-containing protein n=1 Tax=Actinomadura sp. KC06 TaxID=2530369 RepID=UPI0010439B5C|nr:winged helix DNA-binding domain-containing protein [Actinomadura sp. KC06]TDD25225.1 winged helix DNA-binding domain-containing protein [Actinomadura sp. KC06]